MNENIQPTHRHYKGGLYRVLHTGHLEFDLTPVVIYQSCETGAVWVRPTAQFVDFPTGDGVTRRFEPIKPEQEQL